jgi:hypothetical protein
MAIAFKVQEDFETGMGQLFSVLSDVSAWVVFDRPRLAAQLFPLSLLIPVCEPTSFMNF